MDKYVNQKKINVFFSRETRGFLFAIFMSGESGFRTSYFINIQLRALDKTQETLLHS
jgi:hypothetical protein